MDLNLNPTIASALISAAITIVILLINGIRQRAAFDAQIKQIVKSVENVPIEYIRKDIFELKMQTVELKLDNLSAMINVSKELNEIRKLLLGNKR